MTAPDFLSHDGGPCPVPVETVVEVRLRGDDKPWRAPRTAAAWYWGHLGNGGDIIAYRIVFPAVEPAAEAEAREVAGLEDAVALQLLQHSSEAEKR